MKKNITLYNYANFAFFICLVNLFSSILSSQSLAQANVLFSKKDSQYHLSEKTASKIVNLDFKKSPMSSILEKLTKESGINIIADDIPRLEEADINFKGSAKGALDAIASTYDFNWSVSKLGVIVMRKRFKSVNEFPQMNLLEAKQMVKELKSALSIIPFDPSSIDNFPERMRILYRSLTPTQVTFLDEGGSIKATELTTTQLGYLQKALWCKGFYRVLKALDYADFKLKFLQDSAIGALSIRNTECMVLKYPYKAKHLLENGQIEILRPIKLLSDFKPYKGGTE